MFELLKNMIKEEWRIYASFFGNVNFALFSFMMVLLSFGASLFIPVFQILMPLEQIALIVHYMFVLFGLSTGAFGLFGREVMNRRFGQASLLAYSSRSLPVSERKIFLNFFIKDIIYYFFLWILPFITGYFLASKIFSINAGSALLLLLTTTLSFMIGLSVAFFLSTIYVHSKKLLYVIIFFSAAVLLTASNHTVLGFFELLPSFSFFFHPSVDNLISSLFIIIILSAISVFFLKIDYPQNKRKFKNSFKSLSIRLKSSKYNYFISKDILDLNRSEGGIGKIIFSFLFPMAIIWVFILIFSKFIPELNFLIVFSIFLGIISSTIYNWLTEYDLFNSYSFLPVRVSTLIKSKVDGYMLINIVPLILLILVSLGTKQYAYFFSALFCFLSISLYSLSINIYLAGLHPNIMLCNPWTLLKYLFSIFPILLILIFMSIINHIYLIISLVLIPVSFYIIKAGCKKWDNKKQISF
ncbi:MAG: hypothetical protein KAI55_03275 [Candidatus Aenigmarchaeota archaeon]|nr:hypothetical protein [Candidatus Aenigmarchaeota archaeon]